MKERRKIPRRYIMFYSRIFDRKTGKLVGYLSDITREGAMIISDEPIEAENNYIFRMDLPDYVFGRGYLNLDVHCVWSRPDVNPDFYLAGFRLMEIEEVDGKVIDQINKEYGLRDR